MFSLQRNEFEDSDDEDEPNVKRKAVSGRIKPRCTKLNTYTHTHIIYHREVVVVSPAFYPSPSKAVRLLARLVLVALKP